MPNLFYPDTVAIARRVDGGLRSFSNEPIYTPTVLQNGVPCKLDPVPAASRMGGDLKVEIEGVVYIQTHEGFFAGLSIGYVAQLGGNPGDVLTVNGVQYVVAANNQGAFVDVAAGDKVTDQNGKDYLVLAAATYYTVTPNRQVRLTYGRAW